MINISKNNYPFYIISFLGLILITYTSFRAAILSFTHDESTTFLWFVPQSFMEIVSYYFPKAGNHIINTLAIKLFIKIFPNTDFFVRLPNLLAHAAYLIFSFLILKRFKSKLILIFGFILLNFNPYMLDFFSLARGYGLSLGFMMISLYFFIKNIENNTLSNIYIAFLFASLSVLSNFVLIHYFLALILTVNLLYLTNKNKQIGLLKAFSPSVISIFILITILFEPIRKLSKFDELYFGGNTDFYHDTIISFINGIKYNQNYGGQFINVMAIGIILTVAIILTVSISQLTKVRYKDSYTALFLTFLLSPVVSLILQHHLLGSQFIINRLTLFFFPLICLAIISFFSYFMKTVYKKYSSIILIVLSVAFAFHTFKSANLKYTCEWKYDANTKNMIFELEKLSKPHEKKIKLGINWLFEPTINYYRLTRNFNWLEEVTRDGIEGNYDFYYIFNNQSLNFNEPKKIKEYNLTETTLVIR